MQTIELPLELTSLINIGWSPMEVRSLIPVSDILQRDVRKVAIPTALLGRIRPSLSMDSFDTLRWFMSPDRGVAQAAEDGVNISVTCDVMETAQRFWGAESTECYRISVVFPHHRTVVVTRSARDILICSQAIAMVFPELLIPAPQTEADVDVVTADVMCACLQYNIKYLRAFFPVIFFLLEDTPAGMNHCNAACEDALLLLKESIVTERKRGWFSSRKRVAAPPSIVDDIEYLGKARNLRNPAGALLSQVKTVLEASAELQLATTELTSALEAEEKAFQSFAKELHGGSIESILSRPPWEEADDEEAFAIPHIRTPHISSLLDMLLPPANYTMLYEDGLASLLRRMAALSRIACEHDDKYVVAWARLCVDRIDQSAKAQTEFARRKRSQAIVQLCVLIHCLTRHLFE